MLSTNTHTIIAGLLFSLIIIIITIIMKKVTTNLTQECVNYYWLPHRHTRAVGLRVDAACMVGWDGGQFCCYGSKHCFKSTIFFLMMAPVDIRPSPCVTQARYMQNFATICHAISELSCKDAKAT